LLQCPQQHTLIQINRGLLAPNCFKTAVSAHIWPRPLLQPVRPLCASWLLKLNAFADWKTTTFAKEAYKTDGKRQRLKLKLFGPKKVIWTIARGSEVSESELAHLFIASGNWICRDLPKIECNKKYKNRIHYTGKRL